MDQLTSAMTSGLTPTILTAIKNLFIGFLPIFALSIAISYVVNVVRVWVLGTETDIEADEYLKKRDGSSWDPNG